MHLGRKIRRRVACLGFLAAALSLSRWAEAFPAEIQTIAKVSQGKNPALVIRMTEAVAQATVSLRRDDGKTFTYPLGNLSAGAEKRIDLDGRLGRHRYEGEMSALVNGEKTQSPLSFETVVAAPLSIRVSRDDLDFKQKTLKIFPSRPIEHATLSVIGLTGTSIEEISTRVSRRAPGDPVVLRWKHTDRDDLVRLEVRVEDHDGFFSAVALTPWSVEIPHQEVLFETGSAQIRIEQEPKLEESFERIQTALQRYAQIRGVQLFIAGHTDTQGSAQSNLELSRRRARAISAWFLQRGLRLPVFYEGFGEGALKVDTKDEVDEPANRRVDYILSVEPPQLTRGSWKRLN